MVSLVGSRSGRTGHNFHNISLLPPYLTISEYFQFIRPIVQINNGILHGKATNLDKGCPKEKGPISTQFRPDFDRFREGKRLVLRSLTHVNGHGWRGKRKRLFQACEERQVDHHDHYPSMQEADIIFGHTYKTPLNDARGKARWVRYS